MNSINQNPLRCGNFTSSEIAALMTDGTAKGSMGKPAYTYIEECILERKLGRSIDTETNARPLSWGNLVESRVFDLLGIDYKLSSKETIVHPDFDCWSGTPDANKFDEGGTIVDIKCPITLKSFCKLVEPIYNGLTGQKLIEHIRKNYMIGTQKTGEKYYWQLVSNAILTGSKYAELIAYCPYKSELDSIRELIQKGDGEMQSKYGWINWASDDELPWLPDGGYYKNLNVIRFEVPEPDKTLLTERVKQGELLLKMNDNKKAA